MEIANCITVERRTDHFILHVGVSKPDEPKVMDRELTAFAVPFTTGVDLALLMFESMFESALELQGYFVQIQERINSLNALGARVKQQAVKK